MAKPGGFTMTEIIIGVVVLTLLVSVAVPVLSSWTGSMHFREISLGVASELRTSRTEALKGGTETMLELDVKGKRYRVARGNSAAGSTVWTEVRPWAGLGAEADWATGPGCGDESDTRILFKPDGTSGGGVVCIKDPSGAERFKVVVNSASGRVSVR